MSEMTQRSNLGRGLAALFGEESEDYAALDKVRSTKDVPIEHLHPNPRQPRQTFDEELIAELADSIKMHGLLQPILVRRHPERPNEYEIIAGERRWRAAQLARLHEVPAMIRELDDAQTLELALVENLQRQDLTALEEAQAYRHLMKDFGHSQDALGRVLGKSRSHVANTVRLLKLPTTVKDLLQAGDLSAGHARALLNADDPAAVAKEIVTKKLSVRQTERLVKSAKVTKDGAAEAGRPSPASRLDPDTAALERDLSMLLGLKVSIAFRGSGGAVTIHYKTLEQLDDVLNRLNQAPVDR